MSFDQITSQQLRASGVKKWVDYPDCIGAWIAEMDFGTAPSVTEAMHRAVASNQYGYPPVSLFDELRQSTAQWYATEYGWEVPDNWVQPIPDVLAGLEAAINHFSPAGSKVILPTPSYMPFFRIPRLLGREIIELPLLHSQDGWQFDFEGLARAFDQQGGYTLVLCNPYNPVGRVFTGDELQAISEVVDRFGGRVFVDEIHAPITHDVNRHVPYASLSPEAAAHSITATSASKMWNIPGLKCGQLILSNEEDAETWSRVGAGISGSTSTIGMYATVAAYTGGRGWRDEVLSYLAGNFDALEEELAEHLPRARFLRPEGTYLAWIDLNEYSVPEPADAYLRQHAKVAVINGLACGEPGRGFIRMVVATPRPILRQAIRQLAEALS